MTQDEHDALCWRALKRAIVETKGTFTREALKLSEDMQVLMTQIEVFVESRSNP